jgi:hypothetical protein
VVAVVELNREHTVVVSLDRVVAWNACAVVEVVAVDLRREDRRGCMARKRWLGDIFLRSKRKSKVYFWKDFLSLRRGRKFGLVISEARSCRYRMIGLRDR